MKIYSTIFFIEDNPASFVALNHALQVVGYESVLVVLIKASYGQNYSRIRDAITDIEQINSCTLNIEFANLTQIIDSAYKQLYPGDVDQKNYLFVTSSIISSYISMISKKYLCDNTVRGCTPLDQILGTCLDLSIKTEHVYSHKMSLINQRPGITTNVIASYMKDSQFLFADNFSNCGIDDLTLDELEGTHLLAHSLEMKKINMLEANLKEYRTSLSDREVAIVKRIREVQNEHK